MTATSKPDASLTDADLPPPAWWLESEGRNGKRLVWSAAHFASQRHEGVFTGLFTADQMRAAIAADRALAARAVPLPAEVEALMMLHEAAVALEEAAEDYRHRGHDSTAEHCDARAYELRHAVAAALAARATGAVPEGWKLVPVEPTEDMLFAAEQSKPRGYRDLWSAMLAATPPATGAGEAR